MTRKLYVVPGLLSSELWEDALLTQLLWVSGSRLIGGYVGEMRLAANGRDPGQPDGVPLFAGEPLPDYFAPVYSSLLPQLRRHDYTLSVYGYDWRKGFLDLADGLVANIRATVPLRDPCTLVAHSMGGLVARRAYQLLSESGDAGLVRRVITMGTPHQGSYAVVEALSGTAELLDQLQFICNVAGGNLHWFDPLRPRAAWNLVSLRDMCCTWPSFYYLFPLLGGTDSENDPHRPLLFAARNWHGGQPISQLHLDTARAAIGEWLRASETFPPSWVLTTVAGVGYTTPARLVYPDALGYGTAVGYSDVGDGAVTEKSALVPLSAQYQMIAQHADLPLVAAQSGLLMDWILDPRSSPDPIPPLVDVPGINPALFTGPPLNSAIGGALNVADCARGTCSC